MNYINPVLDPNTVIDFYAGNDRSYIELLPLWDALKERRGTFFASQRVKQNGVPLKRVGANIEGDLPVVISSYKDLSDIFISAHERPFIMYEMQHNTETRGLLNVVSLFICKDKRTLGFRKGYQGEVQQVNNEYEAAERVKQYCKGKEVKHITEINGESVGLVYMAWGDKAKQAIKKSLATLRFIGYSYPVCVVGDVFPDELYGKNNVTLDKDFPFDTSKAHNFQFRAGRIKPQLCHLSPFDLNLYLDADTKFIQPIQSGFEMLADNDLLVTEEKLSLDDLYNKHLAGWELNMLERDTTIIELDNDSEQKFINSGVMFFRKNNRTLRLFADWYREWMRFQEWDEQLALMRAINRNKEIKVKHLSVDWNSPQLYENTIIHHNYGRGDVRVNVK
jgi:hypothetical protein